MAAFTVPESLKPYTVPNSVSIAQLECRQAFDGLTPQEQAYALALSDASWAGAKICLMQPVMILQRTFLD